ncbi:MbnP family copper-binding protein [Leptospira kanakyensis]|uniref:MbnP family copper-binding protein n=1 Tax=Leptospira kanakyensis TaxID=2484968 RepID=UPI00223DFC0C|nr:MbnP family copper-binding protein [Leptospira kanakyensis]MCW7479768.1 metallo-mystery pair system four-Cys motif protein [Leptospira kanakyensis]
MNIFKKFFIFLSILGVVSCDPNSKSDDNQTLALLALAMQQPVNLNFEALVGGQSVTFNDTNLTVDGKTVKFKDFRYYISEVKLIRADGSTADVTLDNEFNWQNSGVALVDFETIKTSDTRNKVTGSVLSGNYSGIQFTVGVPDVLNHLDRTTASAPLNIGSMTWAWSSGYKHANIEFSINNDAGYTQFHLGSTTCNAAPNYGCTKKYRASIQLSGEINPSNQKIVLDVDKLLVGYSSAGAVSCMPGTAAPCDTLVQAFGLNISSGAVDSSITQRVFSLK